MLPFGAGCRRSAETRLATYGTLAPGRVNEHQLADLDAFEGGGYRRVIAQVSTGDGELDVWIYVIDVDLGLEQ